MTGQDNSLTTELTNKTTPPLSQTGVGKGERGEEGGESGPFLDRVYVLHQRAMRYSANAKDKNRGEKEVHLVAKS